VIGGTTSRVTCAGNYAAPSMRDVVLPSHQGNTFLVYMTSLTHYSERMNTYALESLRQSCPAIFADRPAPGVSDRYSFIPTHEILSPLISSGWRVTDSRSQSRGRGGLPDPTGFHMLRLIPPGEPVPMMGGRIEACLLNSHNRTRRVTVRTGIWREVCKNGLMLPSGMATSHTRLHLSGQITKEDVIEALTFIARDMPRVAGKVRLMEVRNLRVVEQQEFAAAALTSRYGAAPPTISATAILSSRRQVDEGDNLWVVLNRVQENIMCGCRDGDHHSRPIVSLTEQVRVNTALWKLAEEMLARN